MVTGFNKWLLILLTPAGIYMGEKIYKEKPLSLRQQTGAFHPLHVSVTEVNHNSADKTLEISCRLFTDDFERALAQQYQTKVDLINPPDKPAMEKLVSHFIHTHLVIKANGQPVQLSYLGYEKDNDAIYSYFQVDGIAAVDKIEITNSILHLIFTDQINLMHITVGGKRKSTKLDYPAKEAVFSF